MLTIRMNSQNIVSFMDEVMDIVMVIQNTGYWREQQAGNLI